jgi:hypothetical protein
MKHAISVAFLAAVVATAAAVIAACGGGETKPPLTPDDIQADAAVD